MEMILLRKAIVTLLRAFEGHLYLQDVTDHVQWAVTKVKFKSVLGGKIFLSQQWGCKATLWTSKYCGSNPVMRETEVPAESRYWPYYPVFWGEFGNFSPENLARQQVPCVWVTLSCFDPAPVVLLALLGIGEIFAMLSLRSVPKG